MEMNLKRMLNDLSTLLAIIKRQTMVAHGFPTVVKIGKLEIIF